MKLSSKLPLGRTVPRPGLAILIATVLVGVALARPVEAQQEISWESLGCAVKCVETRQVPRACRCLEFDPETRRCLQYEERPCTRTVCVREERASNTCASGTLARGDQFEVVVQPGTVPADTIEFRLTTSWAVDWWKQLTIGDDAWHIWAENHHSWCDWPDNPTVSCTSIPEWAGVMLAPTGSLTFSKAEEFGIKRPVYRLRNLARWLKPGDRVTFRWVKQ